MPRADGRKPTELRKVEFVRRFTDTAPGSVLVRMGRTHVLCTATWEEGVPDWRAGSGKGWLTAEYDMLPGSTATRRARSRNRLDGRTQEIQRLIGRSLRAVVDLVALGERTIYVDCDVLQADGGTRTAAINGAYVAVRDAVSSAMAGGSLAWNPVREAVAAVSVGRVNDALLLDLDYSEDVAADVDMNLVMTGAGQFVEVQGTGEGATFSREDLDRLVDLGRRGIRQILKLQAATVKAETVSRKRPRASKPDSTAS